MARAKTYQLAFQLNGKLDNSFKGSVLNAQKNLGVLGQQISQLEKGRAEVTRFNKLQRSIRKTEQQFMDARKEALKLNKEIESSVKPTKKMTDALDRAKKKRESLEKTLVKQRDELARLNRKMQESGVDTRNLSNENERLAQRINRARTAQMRLNKVMAQQRANKQVRGERRAQLFDAVALGTAAVFPMMFAGRFEQAMAEVKAVSNATGKDFDALNKKARELGATTSFSASEAAAGMKYLGMAGFKTNQIIAAMPAVLDMARAGSLELGMTSDIASDIMSGFRLEAEQMPRVADVLTKTFTTSNTTLEMLGETMKYVAPVATKAGMSLEQAAAMAGLLGNVGIKESMAGTTLRAMLLRVAAPTGEAAEEFRRLGIDARDTSGNVRPLIKLLGEVAQETEGMGSAEQLAVLKNIFGEKPAAGMAELIAQEGSKGITKYLEIIENSQGTARKVAKEMEDTMFGAFKRLGSAGEGLAISMGYTLIPVLTWTADKLAWLTGMVVGFTEKYPVLTSVISGGIAVILSATVATIALGYAYTFINGGVLNVRKLYRNIKLLSLGTKIAAGTQWLWNKALMAKSFVFAKARVIGLAVAQGLAAAGLKVWTAAQWALNVAMTANPIGLIIAGVAALAVGAYFLIKHWDKVAEFFVGLWDKVKDAFVSFGAWLKGSSLFQFGAKLMQTFAGGVQANQNAPAVAVGKALAKTDRLMPHSDAKEGPLSNLTASGRSIVDTLGEGVRQAGPLQLDVAGVRQHRRGDRSVIQVDFSPTIQIPPGVNAHEVKTFADRSFMESEARLKRLFEQFAADDRRLSFEGV